MRRNPKPRENPERRRICFVTGTRAEFGLMLSTLRAIQNDPRLELQIVATGVHTHRSRGKTIDEIKRLGFEVDAEIAWRDSADEQVVARETGRVAARLVDAFAALRSEIVLVVGDRVEAFAAASAAHLSGRLLAHVHGGDRAMGQADDALRHAISKLAHLHLPATRQSADRLYAMGEERRRIITVGAPGIDGIIHDSASGRELVRAGLAYRPGAFVLFLLHPTSPEADAERRRTRLLIQTIAERVALPVVALFPNNDPGAQGIVDALGEAAVAGQVHLLTHVGRRLFLGLMRDCRLMVGNSSAGIIEAGSFGTPVVNIGPRQAGRERGANVLDAPWSRRAIEASIVASLDQRKGRRADNPYGRGAAGLRIARALARVPLDQLQRRKLIRY